MTDFTETHVAIAKTAQAIDVARMQLAALMMSSCPGPHAFVQHRDRLPPWCKACRYTRDGRRLEES
jgi:hypothetical protein